MIELLVSLAVISILLSLILPIIQLANEAARQSACMNNLRQIGMALSESEASSGKIPSARIATKDVKYQRSVHVSLLQFLEQSALYEQYDAEEDGLGILKDPPTSKVNGPLLAARVAVYLCPSDPSHILRNSYRICSGTSPGMHETTDQPGVNQSLSGFRSKSGRKNPAFIDGRSNTVAFSERVAGDGHQSTYVPSTDIRTLSIKTHGLKTPSDVTDACNWPSLPDPKHVSFAGSTWLLSGYTQTWYNHILVPNAITTDCTDGGPESLGAYSARSYHDGSVNILLADGAIRRASNEIDLAIWRALGTVAGGEEIGDY
ncbi:MAG: DUF1559 domain-containing protein [Planctomycetaceae bacterium]|nr:DUF1559 domain-containing protein [Planctomycetaceae bacterium]